MDQNEKTNIITTRLLEGNDWREQSRAIGIVYGLPTDRVERAIAEFDQQNDPPLASDVINSIKSDLITYDITFNGVKIGSGGCAVSAWHVPSLLDAQVKDLKKQWKLTGPNSLIRKRLKVVRTFPTQK